MEKAEREFTKLTIRNVPKDVLRGIGVLATTEDTNKSEYIRRLLEKHVEENLPENMIKRL